MTETNYSELCRMVNVSNVVHVIKLNWMSMSFVDDKCILRDIDMPGNVCLGGLCLSLDCHSMNDECNIVSPVLMINVS
ncbi:hypothetical protein CEXT_9371 [Caerostris extrusa]|uniref:Uncharacterized protein n=1 Tax=Caerostris extrusa TaxID=172846 RepID=A0AAV4NQY7_CAEEX|nr:hypothetical protein CEXT_9371 [Caerostris extrusa]